jgi:tRNA G18 (ribose-2'-O)-methylase SpoU
LKRAETILRLRTDRIALVLEHSSDYQNIAACIRTAESFGITTVFMVKSATMRVYRSNERDEGDIAAVINAAGTMPHTSSSSARVQAVGSASAPAAGASSSALPSGAAAARSAHSWVNIRPFTSISECIRALREDGREIWATDLSPGAELLTTPREAASFARLGIYQPEAEQEASSASPSPAAEARSAGIAELPTRLAIVMGRETDGVSPAFLAAADKRVFIPMVGFAESFNLSVATALVVQKLFDICPEGKALATTDGETLTGLFEAGRHAAWLTCVALVLRGRACILVSSQRAATSLQSGSRRCDACGTPSCLPRHG